MVDPEASHTESAWMARLPSALTFLLSPWWGVLARGRENDLYFTVPPRIRAGESATLLVNSTRSDSLSGCEELRLLAGFNGWSHKFEGSMVPLPHNTEAPHWHAVRLMPPADAYEMEFTLSDKKVLVLPYPVCTSKSLALLRGALNPKLIQLLITTHSFPLCTCSPFILGAVISMYGNQRATPSDGNALPMFSCPPAPHYSPTCSGPSVGQL